MGFLDKILGRQPPEHPVADAGNEAQTRRAEGMQDRPSAADDPADRLEQGVAEARDQGVMDRQGDPFTG